MRHGLLSATLSPDLRQYTVRAHVREKMALDRRLLGREAGRRSQTPQDVRSGRPAGRDLATSASGAAKWRSRPSKNRQLAPFSRTFFAVFTGFFGDLAQKRANWREFSPEKRWF